MMLVQIDSKYRYLDLNWVVTDAALAQGARGATTEIFAPVQAFFQVSTVSDLQITVSPPSMILQHLSFLACYECMPWLPSICR